MEEIGSNSSFEEKPSLRATNVDAHINFTTWYTPTSVSDVDDSANISAVIYIDVTDFDDGNDNGNGNGNDNITSFALSQKTSKMVWTGNKAYILMYLFFIVVFLAIFTAIIIFLIMFFILIAIISLDYMIIIFCNYIENFNLGFFE